MNVEAKVSFDLLRKLLGVATDYFFLVVLICFSTCLLELLSVATLGRLRGSSYSRWSSFRPANVLELTILVWVCLFGIFSFSGCKLELHL